MNLHPSEVLGVLDVLVVDADPRVGELVRKQNLCRGAVRMAATVDQATLEMRHKPADLLLVNIEINDNAGLSLMRTLREKYPRCEVIAISRVRRSELYLEAWRAGAADMLLAPLKSADVERSFNNVAARRASIEKLGKRNIRLRQVCKQLNKARHEISQQVDLLCNDLVRAYQEMAQQLNVTQQTGEYAQALGDEIEVEGLLRKTMEWILQKVGPVNAAVYLPDPDRSFALGAYLNLDTAADAPLIEAVSDTLVKHADLTRNIVVVDDDRILKELFGTAADRLKGRSWVGMGCLTRRDCLAVIVIFRNQGQAIDPTVRSMIEAIAPVLGDRIEQALGLHHRLHPFPNDPDDE